MNDLSLMSRFEDLILLPSPITPLIRERTKAAIARWYELGGIGRPAVIWCADPWQLAMMPMLMLEILTSDKWLATAARASISESEWAALWPQIWEETGQILLDRLDFPGRVFDPDYLKNSLLSAVASELFHAHADLSAGLKSGALGTQQVEFYSREEDWPDSIGRLSKLRDATISQFTSIAGSTAIGNAAHAATHAQLWMTVQLMQAGRPGDGLADTRALGIVWLTELIPGILAASTSTADLESSRSESLGVWSTLAESCSAIYPLYGVCFVCEKPQTMWIDNRGRLHNPDGPAVTYHDGLRLWAWNGLVVHNDVIEKPETISVKQIENENNVELLRVLLERFGEARFIQESGLNPIHEDKYGVLYKKFLEHDEPLAMVRVVDSTSSRYYYLRVPPGVRTAKQAVAWTFGFDKADDYDPSIES